MREFLQTLVRLLLGHKSERQQPKPVNKRLTSAFGAGVGSTDFKPTQAGEEIPLETADWNAKTVHAWRRFWERHSDKTVWESMIAARKEGKGAPGASKDKAKDDDK